jgi:ABC-2 type transport system ATP-binding protein
VRRANAQRGCYAEGSVIEVEGLSKCYRVHERPPGVGAALRSLFHREYRSVDAVRDVTFRIAAGERVGFLGPNGAGKTTTLKMLSGLLAPSAGRARVCGFTPFARSPDFLRSIMLVAGQKQQLLWDLPPADTFELNRAIYGVARAEYTATRDELVELLRLEPLLGKPVRQLSLGERMKCELAAALLHRPRVLFLDEPTIGLDVTMQVVVRDFIRRYNERHGAAVILTSHYMDDVAALCPRIIVIDRGQIVWDGPLTELVHQLHPEKRVVLKLARPVDAADLAALGARVVSHSEAEAQLRVDPSALARVVGAALQQLPVVDLSVEDAPLEEVMATLFARHA